jgi:poly(A) polymerase
MKTRTLNTPSDDPLFDQGFWIVERLQEEGYTAYFAGGCVRDRLMRLHPEDYDIATDAPPERVEKLFSHTLAVGKAFGVIIVIIDGVEYDVARFRRDQEYEDGRRPTDVEFSSPKEDVKRRDFTVNGLLWDPVEEQAIDYVDGLKDLERELIRTIGEPEERFTEDYLRMLRAPRFAAQLDFEISNRTAEAIKIHAGHLTDMAEERILDEFKKLISTSHPAKGIRSMRDLNLLEQVLPAVDALDNYRHGTEQEGGSILDHVIRTLERWSEREASEVDFLPSLEKEERIYVGCSILFHDIARPESEDPTSELSKTDLSDPIHDNITSSLKKLRASNDLIRTVRRVVKRHRKVLKADQYEQADWKRWMSDDSWPYVKWVCTCVLAECPGVPSDPFDHLLQREKDWSEDDLNPDRLLTGNDLKEMGLEPGPAFGEILETVRRAQLNDDITSREEAMELTRQHISQAGD